MNEINQLKKRADVPIEDTWNLSSLFQDFTDFHNNLTTLNTIIEDFSKQEFFSAIKLSEINLVEIIDIISTYEDILRRMSLLSNYVYLGQAQDYTNITFNQVFSRFTQLFSLWSASLSEFESSLYNLSEEIILKLMEEDKGRVSFYRNLINKKKHRLADEIEKVLASYGSIFKLPEELYQTLKLADMVFPEFTYNGKTYPLSYVLFENDYQQHPDTEFRRKAFSVFSETLEKYGNTFALAYQSEVSSQVTTAKIRKYENVIDYLLSSQEVDSRLYHRQIDVIMDKLAPVMRRYANVIKHNYNLDKLTFSDLKLHPLPDINPKVSRVEAEKLSKEALAFLGEEYNYYIDKAFSERWIDWAQNQGKSTGGFCSSPYGTQGYILLSWNGLLSEVFTLIHELGHAVHFALTNKYNKLLNTNPSLYLIEAPSTFNELLLTKHLLQNSKDEELKAYTVASMLANTYFHNMVTHLLEAAYQRKVYELASEYEALDFRTLCQLKLDTLTQFWGEEVDLTYGELTWMRQPHYYSGLYPYTYSAGLSLATYLAKQLDTDRAKEITENWIELLKAGANYTPLVFAKKLGVDLDSSEILDDTIEYISNLVSYLEEYSYKNIKSN